jgi:hypothetical protein
MKAPMVENTFRKNLILVIVLAYSLSRPVEILPAVTCSHLVRHWFEATRQLIVRCYERQASTLPESRRPASPQ